jgi:predicted deacylase
MDTAPRSFELVEHAGGQPGPTVALLGGVHGDEEEGVLAVQRVSRALRGRLLRGSVRAVAVAHPAAYADGRRVSPIDGIDLARCFPGSPGGSPTEALAHELTSGVIAGSDLLVDLHSGGRDYEMPTFVGYVDTGDDVGGRARRAAVASALPLVWRHAPPIAAGRSLSAAADLGIAGVYVEGSGRGSLEETEVQLYVGGVLNILADLGMVELPPRRAGCARRIVRHGGGDLDAATRAPCDGRFVAHRHAGETVSNGDFIGTIVSADGSVAAEMRAPSDGTVMYLRRTARIAAGDTLFALGSPATPWSDA